MKIKSIITVFVVITSIFTLFACANKDGGSNNYPDGAIAITADNLTDYFDIKVRTETEYDYDLESTRVVSYVSLVPKGEYKKIVGEITYDLNARVRQYGTAGGNWRVSNTTQTLRLRESGITSAEIKLTVNGGGTSYTTKYSAVSENENITLKSVYGYVIPGEKKLPAHESITDSQRAESGDILSELKGRVEEFKGLYTSSNGFNYISRTEYSLSSAYGSGLDRSDINTHNAVTVDHVNDRFKYRGDIYYNENGKSLFQSLDSYGFISVGEAGMTLDTVFEEYAPVWSIFDQNAVYIRENNHTYYAITTLYEMSGGVIKERLLSGLTSNGITTRHNRMTVVYEYSFDEGGFLFSASVDYTDYQYDVDFVGIHAQTVQKITDLNNVNIELYDPAKNSFLPADSLEEAMSIGSATITLKKGQTSIDAITFSTQNKGYTDTTERHYFPLVIEESGVYSFTPEEKTITIYNSDGRAIYTDGRAYFTAGTYYLRVNSILYGKNERRINVEANYLRDYGDLSDPTPITLGEYSFILEDSGDRVVYSFTPQLDGIYDFGGFDYVTLRLYLSGDTEKCIEEVWSVDHTILLSAGVEYLVLLEYKAEGEITVNSTLSYVGVPTRLDEFVLSSEWQDVFLWWDEVDKLAVSITTPGEYYVEFEWIDGQEGVGGSFYTMDGGYINRYKYVYIDGVETKITQLDSGDYYYDVGIYSNRYFIGRVRLVTYATRVVEAKDAVISTEEYTTLTTSDLAVVYSSSTFTFEVTQDCVLYCTTDSDFFAIYDENGERVFINAVTVFDDEHNIWVEHTKTLAPGTYTIVFTISEYTNPGVKTAHVRLCPV